MKLKGLLLPAAALTAAQRAEMFALMQRHYENVTWAAFTEDLQEKQWVILLLDPRGESVCGFSTQRLLDAEVSGRKVKALFSGDTIVARDLWGDSALAHVWGRLALSLIDGMPEAELYWFLISKGYKTYRFLPLFFREFYPRCGVSTPAWAREVLDALGQQKFPGAYDRDGGVVRAAPGKDRLRPGVADLSPARLLDPHVRFFVERNLGHADGDELCCLAPLTRANFTAAAYRVIGPEPALVGVTA
jgi:hypothetical protein